MSSAESADGLSHKMNIANIKNPPFWMAALLSCIPFLFLAIMNASAIEKTPIESLKIIMIIMPEKSKGRGVKNIIAKVDKYRANSTNPFFN